MPTPKDTKVLRAIRRSRAIASGNLAGYRMVSRTERPKKGRGAGYRRNSKHPAKDDT